MHKIYSHATATTKIRKNYLHTQNVKTGKEILRFLVVGTFVNATDIGIYFLLIHYLNLSLSKGISFTCAGIVGYLFNKYWTFKHPKPSYTEIWRYTLINFLALEANILINQSILSLWPGAIWLALVFATALTGLLIFICFKWWVFKT